MEVSLPIGAIGGNLITNSFVPNSFIQQLNASSASLSEDRSLLSIFRTSLGTQVWQAPRGTESVVRSRVRLRSLPPSRAVHSSGRFLQRYKVTVITLPKSPPKVATNI